MQIYMNFATHLYFYRTLRPACKIDEVNFFQLKIHTDKRKNAQKHTLIPMITEPHKKKYNPGVGPCV